MDHPGGEDKVGVLSNRGHGGGNIDERSTFTEGKAFCGRTGPALDLRGSVEKANTTHIHAAPNIVTNTRTVKHFFSFRHWLQVSQNTTLYTFSLSFEHLKCCPINSELTFVSLLFDFVSS